MAEWNVRGSTHACFSCRRDFAPEEQFYSALYFVPPEIERRDFCPTCWHELSPGETVAYWQLRAPEAEGSAAKVGPLDMAGVKRLIKVDLQRPTAPPGLAGLLCLMLARRRLVKLEAVEARALTVRFRDEDDTVEVPAPTLEGEDLERAQAALWDILDQVAASKRTSS